MGGVSLFNLLGKLAVDGVDETTKALDNVAKQGKETQEELSVSFQDISKKAGDLGKKAAIGLAGIGAAALASVEGTKEFRQDLGRLEAGYESVGFSTEAATNTFKDMYAILGEDDTAIEASNLMKELVKDEQGLVDWTNIAAGVYARFPDSIPIEGLIESANETAKVGQITGSLADAINWASASNEDWKAALGGNQSALSAFNKAIGEGASAEDAFNEALLACNNETEREELLRSTMNTLYGESATNYKETNKSVMDNNRAQAELNLQMAETAKELEPLITKGKIFLSKVLLKLQPVITWMIDNINILAPIIITFITSLFALNIAGKIMNLIPVLKMLFTVISTNPIILIIGAIIAAIVLLIANWDKVKEVTEIVWEAIKNFIAAAVEVIKNIIETVFNTIKTIIETIFNAIKAYFTTIFNIYKTIFTTAFNVLKTVVTTIINAIKAVITAIFNAIKTYFTTVFNVYKTIFTTAFNVIKTVITTIINSIKKVIETVFNAIKNTISNIFNGVKNVVSNVWNGIKNTISGVVNTIKNTITGAFETVKNNVANIFNGIKTTISNIWGGVTQIIKAPINTMIDLINGFIRGLNNIKVPDWVPAVGGKGINIPLIPKLQQGGILEKGEIGLLEGNGAEAVVPLHNNKKWISKVAADMDNATGIRNSKDIENKLDRLINLLTYYLPVLTNRQLMLSTGELVGALCDPMDKALADKAEDRRRGR